MRPVRGRWAPAAPAGALQRRAARRAARLGLLVAAAILAAALAAPALAAPQTVKVTATPIMALGADGPLVGYATEAPAVRGGCVEVVLWNPLRRSARRVSGRATCGASATALGGISMIAVARGDARTAPAVAWLTTWGGNTESGEQLHRTTARGDRIVASARRDAGADGRPPNGTSLTGLVGDGASLLVTHVDHRRDPCATPEDPEAECGTVTGGLLSRVAPTRLVPLVPEPVRASALGSGRWASVRRPHTVAIRRLSDGRSIADVSAGANICGVAFSGTTLAIATPNGTIEVWRAGTGGAYVRARVVPVAAPACTLRAARGYAVYTVRRSIRVVNLTTGRDVVLATHRGSTVGATMESTGVVYARNARRGARFVGVLTFVPFGQVVAAFRARP